MRSVNDKQLLVSRASRLPAFLSSFRKKKPGLIVETFTTHKVKQADCSKTIACNGYSTIQHIAAVKEDRPRKEQPRNGGRNHYSRVLLATLPCISTQSSFIRSTSSKILPFSPPSSSPLSSSSSSSNLADNLTCGTNTVCFAPIETSDDTSSASLYSPRRDSVVTTNRPSATTADNPACKPVGQELVPCNRVFSLVIPAQGKATAKAACSSRKGALGVLRKEKNEVLVTKLCREPYAEFMNSIAEMILDNMDTLWDEAQLRKLLRSYLNLNAPRHHTNIKLAFAHAIITIDNLLSSPP